MLGHSLSGSKHCFAPVRLFSRHISIYMHLAIRPASTPCVLCELHAGDVLKLGKAVGVHEQGGGAGGVAAQHLHTILQVQYLAV